MKVWDNFRIAFRALSVNKLRSLLTLLGIIVGVASVITMVAVGSGLQTQVAERIRSLGSNLLIVVPGAARDGRVRLKAGSRHTLTERDAHLIAANIATVSAAAPSVAGRAQVVRENHNWRTQINGTTSAYFLARDWGLDQGRYFTDHELAASAKVAILGQTVAKRLFGESSPVGERIRIIDTPFVVIGTLEEKGTLGARNDQDDQIFLPISTAKRRVIGSAHEVSRQSVKFILVKVASEGAIPQARKQIRKLLRARHRLRPQQRDPFRIRNPAAAMSAQRAVARTVTYFLAAIASVSLVVGGISIMNIMLVSVSERTREIGLRMAVGARPKDVRNQFLIEALTLCLLGGVIGAVLGTLAAVTIGRAAGWPIFLGLDASLFAVGFAASVGLVFGYYPALKASRMDPIAALRFE